MGHLGERYLGSSSGGRNAIDFAEHLSKFNLEPYPIAAVDAAFSQANTRARPEAALNLPRTSLISIPCQPPDGGSK